MKNKILFALLSFSFVLFSSDAEEGNHYNKLAVHPAGSVAIEVVRLKKKKPSSLAGIKEELEGGSATTGLIEGDPITVKPCRSICDCSSIMSRMSAGCKSCVRVVQVNYGCFPCCREDTLCCCLRCCYK